MSPTVGATSSYELNDNLAIVCRFAITRIAGTDILRVMTARPSPTNATPDDTCERQDRIKRLCEAMDHARGQNRMYRALLDRIQSEADTFRMAFDATTIRDKRDR